MSELPMFIDKRFQIPSEEGEDKRISIEEAIGKFLKPRMMLHFSRAGTSPCAFGYEIIRQFAGKKPRFRVVSLGATNLVQLLCATDLIDSLIVSYAGDVYPRPNVSPIFQRAFGKGVKIQNWSIASIISRLMAGAMGLGFMPTRSIIGSTMESENADSLRVIDDPFCSGKKVALVQAIRPDISVVHAWCADRSGNAIIVPPLADSNFACYASRNGVILSVEKIVSTEFIRQHANVVKLPSHLAKAIVEIPFGGHPSAHFGLYGEGYGEDLEFIINMRRVSKDEETLRRWIDEWVLSVDHEKYLSKLGTNRLMSLVGLRASESWRTEIKNKLNMIDFNLPCNAVERAIINGSREVVESTQKGNYRIILAGQGISNLAAWMATYNLRDNGFPVNLLAEIGFFGYLPRPASPFIFNEGNIPTCLMLPDSLEALGMTLYSEDSIAVLAAAQIDRKGNINDTRVGSTFLVGSGGANDIGSNAKEIVVIAPHEELRLVDEVSYITVPGERVTRLVTDQAVFEKIDGEFVLTKCLPLYGLPNEMIVAELSKRTGWKIRANQSLSFLRDPSKEEIRLLRLFDPERYFLGKMKT